MSIHRQRLVASLSSVMLCLLLFVPRVGAEGGFLQIQADDPPESLRGVSSALTDASDHMARIAQETTPSVVHILAEYSNRNGAVEETGSGVVMSSPGANGAFVVTNRHVVTNSRLGAIRIRLQDGRVVTPNSKFEDAATDVAVLLIDTPGLRPARWGDSEQLEIGHVVLAMGSPFGLSESVTMGIISAKGRRSLDLGPEREVINQDFLQTDAAINPGNSGGPLIDLQGRVVGINTAIASQGGGNEGIGFSIPINLVRYVVDQLLEHGRVERGFLGVRLDDEFDEDDARRYALDRRRGARVVEVYRNTPAEQAGIRVDDLILSFDGRAIDDENHLIHMVSLTALNRRIPIVVLREGREVTLNVTLIERPTPEGRGELPRDALPAPAGGVRVETTGLSLYRLDGGLAGQLGFAEDQRGLLVVAAPEGGGEHALQLYDVIEEIARRPVSTLDEFNDALSGLAGGAAVLKVRRVVDGESVTRLVVWER